MWLRTVIIVNGWGCPVLKASFTPHEFIYKKKRSRQQVFGLNKSSKIKNMSKFSLKSDILDMSLIYTMTFNIHLSLMTLLLQACLGDQASVQQSLQQLQALGEQLKSQVDASSSAALQSDHLSLTHHLATLEHALHRQQEVLQVRTAGKNSIMNKRV